MHLKLVLSAGESVSVVGRAGSDLGRTHIWFSGLLYPLWCDESMLMVSSGYFPVRTLGSFPLSCLTHAPGHQQSFYLFLASYLNLSYRLRNLNPSRKFVLVCECPLLPIPGSSEVSSLLSTCPASPVIGGVTCHTPICLRPVMFIQTSGFLVAMKILSCHMFFLFVQRLRIFI